jgi:hypothetical protein
MKDEPEETQSYSSFIRHPVKSTTATRRETTVAAGVGVR